MHAPSPSRPSFAAGPMRGGGAFGALFGIDSRSFVLFRVALGAVVLLDLVTRSASLREHYSDWGVLPRRALTEEPLAAFRFCVHAWGGSAAFEAGLFVVAGALAVSFVFGRGGWAVAALLWALTVSLQNRNAMVLNKGDQIFRLLLFWSIFMPLRPRGRIESMASAGLLVQASLTWLVSAMLKTGREWFPDGTATYYALQMDHGTTPFGVWLGHQFAATRGLSYGVYFLEWTAPLLLFWPRPAQRPNARLIAVAALTGMHVGFASCLRLGWFPAVSICALLPFLPASAWNRLGVVAAPGPPQGLGPPWNAAAAGALAFVLWLNAARVVPVIPLPGGALAIAQVLRLDQNWAMFAPYPDRANGWFVLAGRLTDDREVDANRPSMQAPSRARPEPLSATFPTARWLYFMTNLSKPENAAELPWFAAFACRRFEAARVSPLPLREVEVVFYRQWVLPHYAKTPPVEEVLLRQACADRP